MNNTYVLLSETYQSNVCFATFYGVYLRQAFLHSVIYLRNDTSFLVTAYCMLDTRLLVQFVGEVL